VSIFIGKKTFFTSLFFTLLAFTVLIRPAQAGFGISPPYVKSDRLIPGTRYEQIVTLLRSSAENDLLASITVNAPEIEDWITLEQGTSFTLPKDKLQVPMKVIVDAPKGAALGNYRGHINIRISSKDGETSGVAVVLGARLDIDLTLTRETFPDFNVRQVKISDFEEFGAPWKWPVFSYFFYRVRAAIRIENTGNVAIAPSRVQLDIFDVSQKKLLETGFDTSFKKVKPYETSDVIASFPTKLGKGQYWGKIKVYKEQDILYTNEIAFTIAAKGELAGGPPALGPWPWVMLAAFCFVILLLILLLIKLRAWRAVFTMLFWLFWPLLFIGKKTFQAGRFLKVKFFRWLRKKTEKYDQ